MQYYTKLDNNLIMCEVCPRKCRLQKGQRGFCHIRTNTGSKIEHDSYGHITGLAVDPIEKKPLFHFYPSTAVLSFGTFGCNMGCRFCQNYITTKTTTNPFKLPFATPVDVVNAAIENKCKSIAFTYNDPVIYFEFATDVARIARENDIRCVAVSAAYAEKSVISALFSNVDAANIDLKSFSKNFYRKYCAANIDIVLDNLIYIRNNMSVWLEITTLLIDGENDSPEEIKALCEWISRNLGNDTPIHFSAFHPAYKMLNKPITIFKSLDRAYNIAKSVGLNYVYLGNIRNISSSSTYCKKCGTILIERDSFSVTKYNLDEYACCVNCGTKCDGIFI